MATSTAEEVVSVGGHRVTLKHLDKVLYPATGTTKADVLRYYAEIADAMLPHLRERAVTLKRWPHGVDGESFFEKACPKYRPEWMPTVSRYTESTGQDKDYCVINSLAALTWLANIATLEFHVPLAGRRSMDRPKTMVFDLDPGPGTSIVECAGVALLIRGTLRQDGLECFAKTSGSKGMQLYVPLNRRSATFDHTKQYAHELAEQLSDENSELIVANMRKSLRKNRVLIDWSQNSEHKTTICAYSLRGREIPRASTPITWDEVASGFKARDPQAFEFEFEETVERFKDRGDLFAPVLELQQSVPR